jgi:hypothetical protein
MIGTCRRFRSLIIAQMFLQQVVWTAIGHILGHRCSDRCGATDAMTVTDTPNNIRHGDDTNYCAASVDGWGPKRSEHIAEWVRLSETTSPASVIS